MGCRVAKLLCSGVVVLLGGLVTACDAPDSVEPGCAGAVRIAITADTGRAYGVGMPITLSARVVDANDDSLDAVVKWHSLDPPVLSIDGTVATLAAATDASAQADACGLTAVVSLVAWDAYDVVPMQTLLGITDTSLRVRDLNDEDEIVFTRVTDGVTRGFLWHGGTVTELGCRPGTISATGAVACDVPQPGSFETYPAIWRDGQLTVLQVPGGFGTAVIARSADVVGGKYGSYPYGLYRWQNGNLTVTEQGGVSATGRPNASGDLPFTRTSADPYPDGFVWLANGNIQRMPGWGRYSTAQAINDAGELTGSSERRPLRGTVAVVAFRSQSYTGNDSLGSRSIVTFVGRSINNQGEAIGTAAPAETGSVSSNSPTGFIYRNGKLALIDDLVSPNWKNFLPEQITDGGLILGWAKNDPIPGSQAVPGAPASIQVLLVPKP